MKTSGYEAYTNEQILQVASGCRERAEGIRALQSKASSDMGLGTSSTAFDGWAKALEYIIVLRTQLASRAHNTGEKKPGLRQQALG